MPILYVLIILSVHHKLKEHTVFLCYDVQYDSTGKEQGGDYIHSDAHKECGKAEHLARLDILDEHGNKEACAKNNAEKSPEREKFEGLIFREETEYRHKHLHTVAYGIEL